MPQARANFRTEGCQDCPWRVRTGAFVEKVNGSLENSTDGRGRPARNRAPRPPKSFVYSTFRGPHEGRGFGTAIALCVIEVRNKKSGGKTIMKPKAKPVKKGKTLGGKKLQRKTTLTNKIPLKQIV